MVIDITKIEKIDAECSPTPEVLNFQINELPSQCANLRHYHYDVFTFLPNSRDDAVKKGMENFMQLPLFMFSFDRGRGGTVDALDWDLQAGSCEGPAPGLEQEVGVCRLLRQL